MSHLIGFTPQGRKAARAAPAEGHWPVSATERKRGACHATRFKPSEATTAVSERQAKSFIRRVGEFVVLGPVYAYRWTLRPWLGWPCRHLPTCSDYAIEAVEKNGPWRGFWLTLSRLARCQPWGTAGFDPVPDIRNHKEGWQPWRLGRWTGAHMPEKDRWRQS